MMICKSANVSLKLSEPIPLNSFPEEILAKIIARVAESSLKATLRLHQVSKLFNRLGNEQCVLQRFSLHEIPFFPWKHRAEIDDLVKRCRKAGNTKAMFCDGIIHLFHQNSTEKHQAKGHKLLAKASEKGHVESHYVYGIVLYCLGGRRKQIGFKVLTSLTQPMLSSSIQVMETYKKKFSRNLWWFGGHFMTHLKESHIREDCNCNRKIGEFINDVMTKWIKIEDMRTPAACGNCLINNEVQLFLER